MIDQMKYVICGEALFDVFAAQGVPVQSTTVPFSAKVGGSPLNVAIGLSRLGRNSAFLAGISTDFLGDRLMAIIESEQLDTRMITRKQGPTTLAVIQTNEQGVPAYSFYGEGAADRLLSDEDVTVELDPMTAIHLGSYTLVTQPIADSLLGLVKRYSGRCLISLDPNIRAVVEPDMEIWRNRLAELLPLVDMIKVSDEDLEAIYPDRKPEAVAEEWLALGPKLLVLTRGGDGASMWSKSGQAEIATPTIEVVDTVGAGDTFQAALLDSIGDLYQQNPETWADLLTNDQLAETGKFAARAAAITCSRSGADLPRREEINQA